MIQQGAAMAGHLLLLLAMGLQARYVLLDARGLLPPRGGRRPPEASRRAQGEEERSAAADDTWVAVDSPHGSPQPVLRRASAVAAAATGGGRAPPVAGPTKLSKADRKALKNRLIQERLKRQQQAKGAVEDGVPLLACPQWRDLEYPQTAGQASSGTRTMT